LFNQQQCFIYSTASFLSKLRAKKVEKLHNSSFYRNFLKLRNGNVSLRELKMDDTPKSVWSRSSFSAAKLDLTVPASGRTGSSLYRTVDAWNYL
jgi:hypothetical protein